MPSPRVAAGLTSPVRWQGLDIYSNILYVTEAHAQLGHLAHRLMASAKFCPETCCVVGNHLSLQGRREQVLPASSASTVWSHKSHCRTCCRWPQRAAGTACVP